MVRRLGHALAQLFARRFDRHEDLRGLAVFGDDRRWHVGAHTVDRGERIRGILKVGDLAVGRQLAVPVMTTTAGMLSPR